MGVPFNPNLHIALFGVVDEAKSPGTVAIVVKEGYMIKVRCSLFRRQIERERAESVASAVRCLLTRHSLLISTYLVFASTDFAAPPDAADRQDRLLTALFFSRSHGRQRCHFPAAVICERRMAADTNVSLASHRTLSAEAISFAFSLFSWDSLCLFRPS
jgi:hypothetical protein